ncbi:phage protein [Staphylococcus aureus]|nr:phage protein [Staphylococcus aureus]
MPKFSNELKEVAIQAAHGATTTQFSNKDLSDAVRKKMIEELGSDTLDYSTLPPPQT